MELSNDIIQQELNFVILKKQKKKPTHFLLNNKFYNADKIFWQIYKE